MVEVGESITSLRLGGHDVFLPCLRERMFAYASTLFFVFASTPAAWHWGNRRVQVDALEASFYERERVIER